MILSLEDYMVIGGMLSPVYALLYWVCVTALNHEKRITIIETELNMEA